MFCLLLFYLAIGIQVGTTHDPPLCSYVVAGLVGELKSPNYPQFYTNIQNCSWKIERPTTPSVLVFYDFEVGQPKVGQKCPSDFVVIQVGRGPLPQMYGPFCGAATPAPVYYQDVLFMNLTIKGTGDYRGFRATFGPAGQTPFPGFQDPTNRYTTSWIQEPGNKPKCPRKTRSGFCYARSQAQMSQITGFKYLAPLTLWYYFRT
ncbi:cubilin [Clonorchis sinensis]|uniref:Cubilin n=1 Tax=Clonorchis sinensis TaxID=79923 RepID=G7YKW4_CLOSI|nr:cubilin [Clonorchis sinensis]